MRKINKWLKIILVFLCLSILVISIFLVMDYRRFLKTSIVVEGSSDTLKVDPGDNVSSLVKKFSSSGILLERNPSFFSFLGKYYFRYLSRSSEKDKLLKVGDYHLEKGMTPAQLLDLLVSGNVIAYKIRFLEGWDFKKIRQTLKENKNISHTLSSITDDKLKKELGLGDKKSLEGWFFPDTYKFANKTKDIDILKRAYSLMQRNLKRAWEARDKKTELKTPYELLILASIIEKETYIDKERKKVSGVFHRRLKKNMPLQTDPTIIYGMGDKYKGAIYRSDLKKDTPYNTYKYKGLPPTPIASPGIESLLAAGQPSKSDALFFVATGGGGHKFSKSYKEHLKAVRSYRKKLKNKKGK